MDEFDEVAKKEGSVRFAHLYLSHFETESDEQIEIDVYKKLVELDKKLGTTASEQLFACLTITTQLDIIEVRFEYWN